MAEVEVKVNGEIFEAELADSLVSRARGLSFRSSGKMLFSFPRDTFASVDMVFLSTPLHLYFMDSDRTVVSVQKAEPWTLDPRTWKLYSPDRPYRYLLESFESLDISEGDRLDFQI